MTEPLFLNGHCLTMPERWTPKRPESSAVKIKTKNKGKQNKKRLGGDRSKRGQKRISYSGAHDGTDLASHASAASRARGARPSCPATHRVTHRPPRRPSQGRINNECRFHRVFSLKRHAIGAAKGVASELSVEQNNKKCGNDKNRRGNWTVAEAH